MTKFNRNYRLTIETNESDKAIVVEYPITLQFQLMRGIGANLNTAELMIYNLSESTRALIFQDRYNLISLKRIILEAGYNDELSRVFQGDIYSASSVRQGSNIVTLISARDGGADVPTTQSSFTLEAGETQNQLIQRLIADFPNLNQGAIGSSYEAKLLRPVVIDGNTWQKIQTYTNFSAFIDLGKVNVLGSNEAIKGFVPKIDSSTGLLETPRRENATLMIKTLFEPRVVMGQIIELESDILPIYNGQYKVIGVKHSGIISGSVSGECISEFTLFMGNLYFPIKILDSGEV